MSTRREFIAGVAGVAVWPRAVHAQQSTIIGFIGSGSPDIERVRSFHEGLNSVGFVEGRNVAIEYRWAEGQTARLKGLTADLLRREIAIVMAGGEPAALAAKAATATVPIVFTGGSDPVSLGLVSSLNRPGANVTGVTVLNVELAPKRLQVLNEVISSSPFAALLDPGAPGFEIQQNELPKTALGLGRTIDLFYARSPTEIDVAFDKLVQGRPSGLVVGASPLFNSRSKQLAALAVRHALPTIFQTREFTSGGGLLSYGGSLSEAYRVGGAYVGRILKGEKAGGLPVQQVTKIELAINLKTAKALGLTIPLPLLGRADEVIE
jgi:ABC-type uncharacterized transport system substrate-binding protein